MVLILVVMFIRYHELKHVVIVGDGDYIEREWDTLATLPKVKVFIRLTLILNRTPEVLI